VNVNSSSSVNKLLFDIFQAWFIGSIRAQCQASVASSLSECFTLCSMRCTVNEYLLSECMKD
jgi:hypothetical protein